MSFLESIRLLVSPARSFVAVSVLAARSPRRIATRQEEGAQMSETPQSPTRVAIIAGGCAGVAAAFWLSSTKDLQERYQVTLWTRGWRLGGKGASGRATDPA